MITRNTQPLTLEQIAQLAPSALAPAAHSQMSHRYAYIPTIDVIQAMTKAGFLPYSAKQSASRDANRHSFTKHMIRFRSAAQSLIVGDSFPEVILVNSHDGSSSYKLMAGLFRLVCSNGMVVSDGMQQSISIRHSGNIIDHVIEGSTQIIANAPKLLDAVNRWTNLNLSTGEQHALAEAAHTLRFADNDGKVDTPVTAAQLLAPRRPADNRSDLWHTLNRVQENVVRGGLRAYGRDANGHRRRTTTREINGIDQDVKLNRALWQLAERMQELKSA